jgi:hypothetical protein
MKSREQIRAEAIAAGIEIRGEDVTDLIPTPESAEATWARFNGKQVPASDDDLVPMPESPETVWARFNGKHGKAA